MQETSKYETGVDSKGIEFTPNFVTIGKLAKRLTYIHTHKHTYVHTYSHTYTHTYIHTNIHTYTYIHTNTHTHTETYIRTYTHTYRHTNNIIVLIGLLLSVTKRTGAHSGPPRVRCGFQCQVIPSLVN